MIPRKLPIGIQDFETLRTEGFVYVDKTPWIHRLISEGNPYFLGRPRRFGKSLLVSTLKAYFLGQKELFEAIEGQPKLAMADLEKDWITYPVFHIDLNVEKYTDVKSLESGLNGNLRPLEEQWGQDAGAETLPTRFLSLIRRACEKSGRKVAVLIDEYDKPLLSTFGPPAEHPTKFPPEENPEAQEEIRKTLKAFYGVLKTAGPWLKFVLLTGVTKFSQVSVFSDLNQLRDISMNETYAGLCGITAEELTRDFVPELRALAEREQMTYDEVLAEMQRLYNGYHFAGEGDGVFNPFSVLNTFADSQFGDYWFKTGTPTFLVQGLKKIDYDLRTLTEGITVPEDALSNYRANSTNSIPLLYQSGYLTIKKYDRKFRLYTLGFPNGEVEYGFLNELLPLYTPWSEDPQGFSIFKFIEDLQKGDTDAFMIRLRAFFADIPYELNDKTERHYQTVFYLVFRLMGQYAQAEVRSAAGRADAVIIAGNTVYVFEFKLSGNGTAESALQQIGDKGYLLPYTAADRRLVKVGAEFDPATRTLGRWVTG
ncbi:ATPase AAA [Spirochaetia bacterium]|nr:ATPase AAA [Spirochaetia bacterium]